MTGYINIENLQLQINVKINLTQGSWKQNIDYFVTIAHM